ncbi:MAG: MBL fold metallo-hydrolase, partial [Pseudomonadota bacterium]
RPITTSGWTRARALFPEAFRGLVDGTQAVLSPLEGRIERVAMDADLGGGISLVPTAGHTPGHVSVLLSSGGRDLMVFADVAIHPVVSLRRPDLPFAFDVDPEAAIATRRAILDRVATDGTAVMSYHWPFPGIGYVGRDGDAYRFDAAIL